MYRNPIWDDPARLQKRIEILKATPQSHERDALIKAYEDGLARISAS